MGRRVKVSIRVKRGGGEHFQPPPDTMRGRFKAKKMLKPLQAHWRFTKGSLGCLELNAVSDVLLSYELC